MQRTSSLGPLAVFGLLLASLLMPHAPAAAAPGRKSVSPPPSIVGYWLGEDVVGANGRETHGEATYYNPAWHEGLTPAAWQVLQDYRVPLYLHVRQGRDFGRVRSGLKSEAAALVRKANAMGIPVIAWIVIPYEQGYWAYEGNAQANFDALKEWAGWAKAQRLSFASVALDQEFSWQNLKLYGDAARSRDADKMAAFMRGNVDPGSQCRAFQTYRRMISWAHGQRIRIDAALAPMVADDLDDGNLALQNALQITATSPGYDRSYLMVYRSSMDPGGTGGALIASYYRSMQKYFGGSGQVSIGIPGERPYDRIEPLAADVRMLAGLGATSIPIYSLEAMLTAFGPEGVKTLAEAARQPMTGEELAKAAATSPAAEAMRARSRASDARATALTLEVTKAKGAERGPNLWPNGCGDLTVAPLAKGARR